jgi:hypothetical protein
VAFLVQPAAAEKIKRYTDEQGTLHISNEGQGEAPATPGTPATPGSPGRRKMPPPPPPEPGMEPPPMVTPDMPAAEVPPMEMPQPLPPPDLPPPEEQGSRLPQGDSRDLLACRTEAGPQLPAFLRDGVSSLPALAPAPGSCRLRGEAG